jgi:phosphopantetheinyl transferase
MSMLFVGNDIVDLTDPRCQGKSGSARFLARIFATEEAAAIRESEAPDETLWLLWAAKEAAFKVVSKFEAGPPPFVHAAFVVSLSGTTPDRAVGHVRYEQRTIPFLVDRWTGALHAVAWWPGRDRDFDPPSHLRWGRARLRDALGSSGAVELEALRLEHFTERERPAVHSVASAAVRIAARDDVARVLGIPARGLEIVCEGGPTGRTPPRLFRDGERAPADVSLSHHGHWVAWAAGVTTGADGS